MNRIIIAFALATLPATASAAAAPTVDASQAKRDRAHVQTVGLLGLLQDVGSAASTVFGASDVSTPLREAVAGLRATQLSSRGGAIHRSNGGATSVSIGAVEMSNARDFQLAEHRDHAPRAPDYVVATR